MRGVGHDVIQSSRIKGYVTTMGSGIRFFQRDLK